jgi:hypothetical protein
MMSKPTTALWGNGTETACPSRTAPRLRARPAHRDRRDRGEGNFPGGLHPGSAWSAWTLRSARAHRSAHRPNGGRSTRWHNDTRPGPNATCVAACAAGTAGTPCRPQPVPGRPPALATASRTATTSKPATVMVGKCTGTAGASTTAPRVATFAAGSRVAPRASSCGRSHSGATPRRSRLYNPPTTLAPSRSPRSRPQPLGYAGSQLAP